MQWLKRALIAISFSCLSIVSQGASVEFVKAEIYYYGWDVMTRGRLSLDDVRRNPMIRTTISYSHEALTLARWLSLESMAQSEGKEARSGDPRLVIDFWNQEGIRTTYYSDGALLISEDGTVWRKIDREFRQRFTFTAVQ
jgi:hypothetical protein